VSYVQEKRPFNLIRKTQIRVEVEGFSIKINGLEKRNDPQMIRK
jgi:hypothetical protein